MKTISLVRISLNNLIRSRFKSIIYLTLISLFFVIVFISDSLIFSLNKSINDNIKENIANRKIITEIEKDKSNEFKNIGGYINKISEYEHVQTTYPYFEKIDAILNLNNNLQSNLILNSVIEEQFSNKINGRFFNKNEKNVAIIPSKIIFNKFSENEKIINGSELLNKDITLKFYSLIDKSENNYTFNVIGVYNVENNSLNINNEILIPLNDIYSILSLKYNMLFDDYINNQSTYLIESTIDSYKNVESVCHNINGNLGYKAIQKQKLRTNNDEFDLIILISNLVLFIILFVLLITICIIVQTMISEQKQEIAISRAVGYRKSDIFLKVITQSLIVIIFSFIISIGLVNLVINLVINKIIICYFANYNSNVFIMVNYYTLFQYFILIIFILITAVLKSTYKITKESISDQLKENI